MEIEKYLYAMKKRCSRRKYTNRPIDSKCVKELEKIILEATAMGLSTCWVGTSYDKKTATALCKENDTLDCVIAIGHYYFDDERKESDK